MSLAAVGLATVNLVDLPSEGLGVCIRVCVKVCIRVLVGLVAHHESRSRGFCCCGPHGSARRESPVSESASEFPSLRLSSVCLELEFFCRTTGLYNQRQ